MYMLYVYICEYAYMYTPTVQKAYQLTVKLMFKILEEKLPSTCSYLLFPYYKVTHQIIKKTFFKEKDEHGCTYSYCIQPHNVLADL